MPASEQYVVHWQSTVGSRRRASHCIYALVEQNRTSYNNLTFFDLFINNLFKKLHYSIKQSEFYIFIQKMHDKPEIKLDYGHHRDQEVVLIRFD